MKNAWSTIRAGLHISADGKWIASRESEYTNGRKGIQEITFWELLYVNPKVRGKVLQDAVRGYKVAATPVDYGNTLYEIKAQAGKYSGLRSFAK